MKVIILFCCLFSCTTLKTFAQEIVEVNQKTDNNLFASYHILKNKPEVKWGPYLLYTRKKSMAVAAGTYTDNKPTGKWRFFDDKGKLLQLYDYDDHKLLFEEPESNTSLIKYVFDVAFKNTDTLTKPIRIGGRYFGYLPYSRLFVAPDWFIHSGNQKVTIELLVSPGGRLAEFNIHLSGVLSDGYNIYNQDDKLKVNLSNLAEEDKIFIPASKNGEPVSSRIIIRAQVTGRKKISFYHQ